MKNEGLCWHAYHLNLISHCSNFQKRVKSIKEVKPPAELEPRLALFKPVMGKLPSKLKKAAKELTTALAAYDKKWSCSALTRITKADAAFRRMCALCAEDIERLHKKECPDCIWNGHIIDFSKWNKKK